MKNELTDKEQRLIIFDGINNDFIEVSDNAEAHKIMKEIVYDESEGIHPDAESVKLYLEIGVIKVEDIPNEETYKLILPEYHQPDNKAVERKCQHKGIHNSTCIYKTDNKAVDLERINDVLKQMQDVCKSDKSIDLKYIELVGRVGLLDAYLSIQSPPKVIGGGESDETIEGLKNEIKELKSKLDIAIKSCWKEGDDEKNIKTLESYSIYNLKIIFNLTPLFCLDFRQKSF